MLLWRERCQRTEGNCPLARSRPPPRMLLRQCRRTGGTEDWTISCQCTQTSSFIWETNMNGRMGNKSYQVAADPGLSLITSSKFPSKGRALRNGNYGHNISQSQDKKSCILAFTNWFSSLKWQWWKYCDFFSPPVRRGNYCLGEDKVSWSDGYVVVTVCKGSDGNFRRKKTPQCFLNH